MASARLEPALRIGFARGPTQFVRMRVWCAVASPGSPRARSSGKRAPETDCVAGVVGLELGNPLGSKSARIVGEFLPIWPKRRSRDSSRRSCGVANVQLWQGFRVALWGRKGEKHGGGAVQYAWLVGFELR
jgi:hypothetical protein